MQGDTSELGQLYSLCKSFVHSLGLIASLAAVRGMEVGRGRVIPI